MNLEKRVKELEIKLSKALQRIEELESFEKENKLLIHYIYIITLFYKPKTSEYFPYLKLSSPD